MAVESVDIIPALVSPSGGSFIGHALVSLFPGDNDHIVVPANLDLVMTGIVFIQPWVSGPAGARIVWNLVWYDQTSGVIQAGPTYEGVTGSAPQQAVTFLLAPQLPAASWVLLSQNFTPNYAYAASGNINIYTGADAWPYLHRPTAMSPSSGIVASGIIGSGPQPQTLQQIVLSGDMLGGQILGNCYRRRRLGL